MNIWTVIQLDSDEGAIPWHGVWATKEGAVAAIAKIMQLLPGECRMTGELEQIGGHASTECEQNGEEWLVSFNDTTFQLVEHEKAYGKCHTTHSTTQTGETTPHQIFAHHTMLKPRWYGYEITAYMKSYGWVVPTDNGECRKWAVTQNKPCDQESLEDVLLYDTLREAVRSLIPPGEKYHIKYQR